MAGPSEKKLPAGAISARSQTAGEDNSAFRDKGDKSGTEE